MAIAPLPSRSVPLPLSRTSLVGRDDELAAMLALMRSDGVPLLTLTGTGGIGKTRLALQVAADLGGDYADGVYFVSLAPVPDPELLVSAIAEALGLSETRDDAPIETVRRYLGSRQLLLLLDNFEHLLPAATVLADLLGAAPALRMIVTSRAPLRLSAEHEFPVPLLALPEPGALARPEALARWPAIALFVERAHAVRPGFRLDADNAETVKATMTRRPHCFLRAWSTGAPWAPRRSSSIAMLARRHGGDERAIRLLGASAALAGTIGYAVEAPEHVKQTAIVAAARASLGETSWAAAERAGRGLTPEQAIAAAIETLTELETTDPASAKAGTVARPLTPRQQEILALLSEGLSD